MRYIAAFLFTFFSFSPGRGNAQPPNIYVVSENLDGTSKSFRYIISYSQIEIYSLEVDDEGEYHAYISAYDIQLITKKKISPREYSKIVMAIDSTLNLPKGSPNMALGGYHWSIKYLGTRDEIFSKRYYNVQKEYFLAIRESIILNLDFIQRKKFRRIYRRNIFEDF